MLEEMFCILDWQEDNGKRLMMRTAYMKLMQESDEEGEKKTAQIVDVHFHLEEDNQEDI